MYEKKMRQVRGNFFYYSLLALLLLCLWIGNLMYGSVSIPFLEVMQILVGKDAEQMAWQHIVWQSRFPQSITALLAGASLATSGLLLQTLFKNPLAGPSILGISDGANLGVALMMFFYYVLMISVVCCVQQQ
jgi:iron complex transport system permease protein